MAKVYARVNDILKAMEMDVMSGAKILAEATKEYLYNKTYKNLYTEMSPGDYYERTYDFLESITVSFVSSANKYRIMFDGRKVKKRKGDVGNFNAHADFNMEKFPIKDLVEGLEYGHPVPHTDNRDGAYMITDTKKWLDNKIKDICLKSSTGLGLEKTIRRYIKF